MGDRQIAEVEDREYYCMHCGEEVIMRHGDFSCEWIYLSNGDEECGAES